MEQALAREFALAPVMPGHPAMCQLHTWFAGDARIPVRSALNTRSPDFGEKPQPGDWTNECSLTLPFDLFYTSIEIPLNPTTSVLWYNLRYPVTTGGGHDRFPANRYLQRSYSERKCILYKCLSRKNSKPFTIAFLNTIPTDLRDKIVKVIVSGSVSRGQATDDSDIDFLVVIKSKDYRIRRQLIRHA